MAKTGLQLSILTNPVITAFLLVLAIAAGVVLSKVLGILPGELSIMSVAAALLIIFLSGLAGALVGRFSLRNDISAAEQVITGMLDSVHQEAQRLADGISKVPEIQGQCGTLQEAMRKAIDSAAEITRIALGEMSESVTDVNGLVSLEARVGAGQHIWILTSALELEDRELKRVIQENLRKGVKYTYLIPKEDLALQERFKEMAKEWATHCNNDPGEQIKCFLVPEHFVYMTVIIYNAYGPNHDPPTVLVKFPTSAAFQPKKYPLVYRVAPQPPEAWGTFRKAFQDMIHTHRACAHTQELALGFARAAGHPPGGKA